MKPIDFDRALLYIDEHGNVQDKARLIYLLSGETPPDHIIRPLLDKQNRDGGFPSRPRGENPSSVDSTLTALWQLNEVGLIASSQAKRAVDFLISTELDDGSWDENPELPGHDLPPWIVPGQQATILYLTAYSAYWLGFGPFSEPDATNRALTYLAKQQQQYGVIPGYQQSKWIATAAFLMAGQAYDTASTNGLSALANRPMYQWEDSQIAWAIDCLGNAGLPLNHSLVQALLEELSNRQEPAGCWASEDGPVYAVSATTSALKAFRIYGLLGF